MNMGKWLLSLLWIFPQLPKKKIRLFLKLGDHYQKKGKHELARFCYNKALDLAENIGAVHYLKKTNEKLSR